MRGRVTRRLIRVQTISSINYARGRHLTGRVDAIISGRVSNSVDPENMPRYTQRLISAQFVRLLYDARGRK